MTDDLKRGAAANSSRTILPQRPQRILRGAQTEEGFITQGEAWRSRGQRGF